MSVSTDLNGFFHLTNYRLLLLKGPDAATFLQGQVTCDINQLGYFQPNSSQRGSSKEAYQSSLGAHCNHKGRMLFSFRAFILNTDTIALSVYTPLLSHAEAALKKYSIFSKVDIINAEQEYSLIAYIGENTTFPPISLLHNKPIGSVHTIKPEGGVVIKVSSNRYECWVKTTSTLLKHEAIANNGDEQWTLCNIEEGIAEVRPETIEVFIPQMLNFQLVGTAISFQKGCYTGQEVVARMQYLGKLKRQMYRFACSSDISITPNMPIYTTSKEQSIGQVALSATKDNKQQLLAVATSEAVTADALYLDQNYQQKLQLLPLPYAITKE